MSWMDRKGLNPVHAAMIYRRDCFRENDELLRTAHRRLQEAQLAREQAADAAFTRRKESTPYDSGMPRRRPLTTTTGGADNESIARSASSAYLMLTSASAHGLRMGGSSSAASLARSASSISLKDGEISDITYGFLHRGQQHWQTEPRVPLSSLPPVQHVECRWPSIKRSAIESSPLRPELMKAAAGLQDDNIRWMAGSWRPRKSASPRPMHF